MISDIYIVSGFLGAGKTTFIQKLIQEAFNEEQVVLIENDFGEISVDTALMRSGGVNVKELNNGCICCSLSGDFVKSLKEVSKRFHPEKVIIEPSGVGKLSDIIKACNDSQLKELYTIKLKFTVADASRFCMHLENFGEFFEDQIEYADIILLNRNETASVKAKKARTLIKQINERASVLFESWDSFNAKDLIVKGPFLHSKDNDCCAHGDHSKCCEEGHDAKEIFDTVTVRCTRCFPEAELGTLMKKLEDGSYGNILRAKGIVKAPVGFWDIQFVPESCKIKRCDASGEIICFIGRNLDSDRLKTLFSTK